MKHKKQMVRRAAITVLGGMLLVQPLSEPVLLWSQAAGVASAQTTGTQTTGTQTTGTQTTGTQVTAPQATNLRLVKEEMLTAGAKRLDYVWQGTRSGSTVQANVHVIEVDLTNPYVSLNVMSGKDTTIANRNTLTNMVKETGAVGGINADYFSTTQEGVPMGPQVTSGTLYTSPSAFTGMYAFALTKERKPVIDHFSFEGQVTTASGARLELSGVNQTSYQMEGASGSPFSHFNRMYMYTSAWTAPERPETSRSATTPTEVLVVDGVVTAFVENSSLPQQAPPNGYILRGHGTMARQMKEQLPIGTRVTADYRLVSLTSGQALPPDSYQMMVGGHTLLIEAGQPRTTRDTSAISGSSPVSRTAIGFTRDEQKVLLVTSERQGNSTGLTIRELQEVMRSLGVWKGLNLDGGGSTTMVDRPLGAFETQLAHPTSNSPGTVQRAVTNGIGVYTSAPQGTLAGMTAAGPSTLFIGQSATYGLRGYDNYFNPVDPGSITGTWTADRPIVSISGNTIRALRSGSATLQVRAGTATSTLPIEVISAEQIAQLTVVPGTATGAGAGASTAGAATGTAAGAGVTNGTLQAGATVALPVRATLTDGRQLNVPAESVTWELRGFTGRVTNGTLQVEAVPTATKLAYAIARYDGHSALVVFPVRPDTSSTLWETFEQASYPIGFNPVPAQTTGSASRTTGFTGRESSHVLQISYDFTNGSGDRFAYATLNGSQGVVVPGQPVALTAEVYSDGSGNWLRAEARDAANKLVYLDLARPMSEAGWRTVRFELSGDIAYPITLRRIYVANPQNGQENRGVKGQVAVDDIRFEYVSAAGGGKVELTVGQRTATVDGKAAQLEVAPFVINGTTYVPLRFVSDGLQGQIGWDQATRRASFLRGDNLLDVWVGQPGYVLNGRRMTSELAPIVRNGRTLVPIRLVSEQLGLRVTWEQQTRKITIQ